MLTATYTSDVGVRKFAIYPEGGFRANEMQKHVIRLTRSLCSHQSGAYRNFDKIVVPYTLFNSMPVSSFTGSYFHFLAHCQLNRNERDFSNTFCNRFLAESDNRGVAFTAFSSALRTNSSAVAPSKTGMFLIVMAIIVIFMQMYYLIVTQQNCMQAFTVSTSPVPESYVLFL